jgi:hypothetical protein
MQSEISGESLSGFSFFFPGSPSGGFGGVS